MSEYFSEDGAAIPVTVVSAKPLTVARVFEKEKDGYDSIQVNFGSDKKRKLKEFRLKPGEVVEMKKDDTVDVSVFVPGDTVQVSSVSKGKGFQGVVKRHGFHGGPRSHGQKHSEREPGSIGGGLRTRVPTGMRMAGRMGSERVTQKNLQVVFVDKENNLMFIKGAIAGRRGTLVEIIQR